MTELSVFSTNDYKSLNLRQRIAFHAALSGENMFIVGGGGVGKSYLTRIIIRHLPGLIVLGSSGTAAVNIGGQTVESFFGLGRHFITPTEAKKIHPRQIEYFKKLKAILIDEFGALRRDKLQLIDIRLRIARGVDLPFGGVQVIAVGDFCQIKPVLPERSEEKSLFHKFFGVKDVYPFMGEGYEDYGLKPYLLNEYVRLDNHEDQKILKSIRLGKNLGKSINALNARMSQVPSTDSLILCSLRRKADFYNKKKFAETPGEVFCFEAEQEGEVDNFPSPLSVELKVGARVVLTVNSISENYGNGDLGTVVHIEVDKVIVQLDRGPVVDVEQYEWNFYSQTVNDAGGVSRKTIGKYRQFPIILAYGITIHRSQGMTIPNVHIDMEGGFFSEGMPYVAFSRAPSLSKVSSSRPIRISDIFVNASAVKMTEQLSLAALSRTDEDIARLGVIV